MMKYLHPYFLSLALLGCVFSSCDSLLSGQGVVVDQTNGKGLAKVKINISAIDSVETDSMGKFHFGITRYGYASITPQLLLSKEGYQTTCVSLKKPYLDVIVAMKPDTDSNPTNQTWKGMVATCYYINLYGISVLNFFTIVVLLIYKRRIRYWYMWLLGILAINPTLSFFYIDQHLESFHLFRLPFYLTHYWTHPFTFEIAVPIITIAYWLYYFTGQKQTIDHAA